MFIFVEIGDDAFGTQKCTITLSPSPVLKFRWERYVSGSYFWDERDNFECQQQLLEYAQRRLDEFQWFENHEPVSLSDLGFTIFN